MWRNTQLWLDIDGEEVYHPGKGDMAGQHLNRWNRIATFFHKDRWTRIEVLQVDDNEIPSCVKIEIQSVRKNEESGAEVVLETDVSGLTHYQLGQWPITLRTPARRQPAERVHYSFTDAVR